jgi:hypothetical protein
MVVDRRHAQSACLVVVRNGKEEASELSTEGGRRPLEEPKGGDFLMKGKVRQRRGLVDPCQHPSLRSLREG